MRTLEDYLVSRVHFNCPNYNFLHHLLFALNIPAQFYKYDQRFEQVRLALVRGPEPSLQRALRWHVRWYDLYACGSSPGYGTYRVLGVAVI